MRGVQQADRPLRFEIVSPPPEAEATARLDAQALIEEARRRQRRRRRWLIGIAVVVLVLGIATFMALHGGGGAHVGHPVHHADRRTGPAPKPPLSAPIAARASLTRPAGMAVAPDGDVLISDQGTNQILRRLSDGTFQVVAGNGTTGFSGDGGPAADAELHDPNGLAVAGDGTIYVADTGNNRVRAISPSGIISTVAGNGSVGAEGVGGPATAAQIGSPFALAIGPQGDLHVADDSAGVQVISPEGVISTVIPTGAEHGLFDLSALAIDGSGDLFVAASSNKSIVEFSPTGSVLQSWVGYVTPAGLAVGPDGNVVIADYGRFAIERIAAGQIDPIASFQLNSIPGVPGTFRPSGVAVGATGEIYATTDGSNGGTNTPALIAIDPDGQIQVLVTGSASIP